MKGYNKIAALMGRYPESAIVSQFSELNIQNLLYLQAEIVGLQQDLRELEEANDRSPDAKRAAFSRNWDELSSADEKDGSNEQWLLVLLIREKLKEYNEALFIWSQILKLQPPHPRDLCNLQEWMRSPSMGALRLVGRDRNVWAEGKDLIAVRGKPQDNKVFRLVADTFTPLYHYAVGKYHKKPDLETREYAPNTIHYSDSALIRIASFLGIILSSMLPVMAIVVLYRVAEMSTRLGLVGTFTAAFSVCLWFMTDGRLIEVFSATSAFAAVQVVFVSTNITSSGG